MQIHLSRKINNTLDLISNQNTKLRAVTSVRSKEDLADYVRRIRADRGLSLNDVQVAAMNGGMKISRGYVSQIENRYIVSVTAGKLKALAKGLGISEDEVFAAARGKSLVYEDPLDLRGLFDGWEEATDADRAAALDDLRMIAERFQRKRKAKPPDSGSKKGKK